METFSVRKIVNIAIKTGSIRVLIILLGFIQIQFISMKFGAGFESDAYLLTMAIVVLIEEFMGKGLAHTLIPVLVDCRNKEGEVRVQEVAYSIMAIVFILITSLSFAIYIMADKVSFVLAPGFSGEVRSLSISIIRMMSPVFFFVGIKGLLKVIINAYNLFVVPAATTLFWGTSIILSIFFLADKIGIFAIPLGALIGSLLDCLVIAIYLVKNVMPIKIRLNLKDVAIKQTGKLAVPRFFVISIGQLNVMVDRLFASWLGAGYISALSYAGKLIQLPTLFLLRSISKTMFPTMCSLCSDEKIDEVKDLLVKYVRIIGFITIPITTACVILRRHIIRFAFERGSFDMHDAQITATALLFYSLGIYFTAVNGAMRGIFLAMQDTITPLKVGAVVFISNILLDSFLMELIGFQGLPLCTSLLAIMSTIALYVLLRKKIGVIKLGHLFMSLKKVILASIIMGATMLAVIKYENFLFSAVSPIGNGILQVSIVLMLALITYLTACHFLQVEEYQKLKAIFAQRKQVEPS